MGSSALMLPRRSSRSSRLEVGPGQDGGDERAAEARSATRRWVAAPGLTLVGDVHGPGRGRPVILLHGGGQTRHAWRDAGATLAADGFRAVAYDARGHGESSWSPDGSYDDEAYVRDLVAVASDVGITRAPVLIGASLGGLTSLAATATNALCPAALVLVDVVPRVDPAGLDRIQTFMASHQDGFETLEDVAAALAAYQPHRNRGPRPEGLAKVVRRGADGRYHWHWDPRLSQPRDPVVLQSRYDEYARAVTVPTLVLRGGSSDVVLESGLRHFQELVPHAEVAEVEGAAHMVAGDDNDAFVAAVSEFLTRVTTP